MRDGVCELIVLCCLKRLFESARRIFDDDVHNFRVHALITQPVGKLNTCHILTHRVGGERTHDVAKELDIGCQRPATLIGAVQGRHNLEERTLGHDKVAETRAEVVPRHRRRRGTGGCVHVVRATCACTAACSHADGRIARRAGSGGGSGPSLNTRVQGGSR